jgi:hypothetical protein
MSTNSTIAVQLDDGTIIKNTCHWDGYESGVGSMLFHNYKTVESVQELLSYGWISSLDDTIEKTEFYHRDRNEDLLPSKTYSNFDEYAKDIRISGREFNYILKDGEWWYSSYYNGIEEFMKLTLEIINAG